VSALSRRIQLLCEPNKQEPLILLPRANLVAVLRNRGLRERRDIER
jgi:hypothetical protein